MHTQGEGRNDDDDDLAMASQNQKEGRSDHVGVCGKENTHSLIIIEGGDRPTRDIPLTIE